jgi:hypothetical protein
MKKRTGSCNCPLRLGFGRKRDPKPPDLLKTSTGFSLKENAKLDAKVKYKARKVAI